MIDHRLQKEKEYRLYLQGQKNEDNKKKREYKNFLDLQLKHNIDKSMNLSSNLMDKRYVS